MASFVSTENGKCSHSYTIETRKHRAISVSFVVIDRYGKLVHEFCYTGNDVIVQFIRNILSCEDILVNATKFNQYMVFNEEDRQKFEDASVCYICSNDIALHRKVISPFTDENPRVRDHDHLTGRFLGAAHKLCNLNKRREKPFLSVFLHNFSGYDSHLLLPYLTNTILPEIESVNVIPRSSEKFMAITINRRITFLDSMNFLTSSLQSLFDNVKHSCNFNIIKQSFLLRDLEKNREIVMKPNAEEKLKYMTRKGSFPYDWAKNLDDYKLPYLVAKEEFYNTITKSHISDEDYKTAKEVWEIFEMKDMRQYMEFYCFCDTLLLAEVFEKFREECMTNFKMEPTHFISLPGFAFQAFFKTTNVHLGHITDPELFDMLSNNLRGGHSFSTQRYEESSEFKNMSNTNTASTFNDIPQHLLYIDANNL